jgi:hypothetical protein
MNSFWENTEHTLIALNGPAGCGKDTAAQMLIERAGFQRLAFADPLKDGMKAIFSLTNFDLYDKTGKERHNDFWGMTHREMLQQFGTETCRHHFRDDIWVKALEIRLRKSLKAGITKNIITDLRFLNEVEAVREWGGLIVHVTRPFESGLTHEEQQHASEAELAGWGDWDWVIHNNGNLMDLEGAMDNFNQIRPEAVCGEIWAVGKEEKV